MTGHRGTDDDVDMDIATAVGLCALGTATIPEAADIVGVTRWELENVIEDADLADPLGIDRESDVADDIDALLDGDV